MELIGKQIAIETILGQPPELHYPSWYAAQIEKLPPAPPEYLAEQAGILVTDSDTISRQAAIDACGGYLVPANIIKQLPSTQPERIKGHWIHVGGTRYRCNKCGEIARKGNFCPNCGAKMREVTDHG